MTTEHEQFLEPRMSRHLSTQLKKKSGGQECFSCSSCLIKASFDHEKEVTFVPVPENTKK